MYSSPILAISAFAVMVASSGFEPMMPKMANATKLRIVTKTPFCATRSAAS